MEYLAYADGLKDARLRAREEQRHQELLDVLVRGSLVASGTYEEKVLFEEYFPPPEMPEGAVATDDADLDLDYSGVDFGVPDESEMEILSRMLADPFVTVSDMNGDGQPEPEAVDLPAPREIAPADIEQDREWV